MGEAAFAALLAAVEGGSFSEERLALLQTAAAGSRLTVAQVGQLLPLLPFEADRLAAARLLRPQIVDPENGYLLAAQFGSSGAREEVLRLFQ